MKYLFIFTLFISFISYGQLPQEFVVELEPLSIADTPGIHSFSWGLTSDQKWVVIGGRLDGLHRRQPWAAFWEQDSNKNVFVIDPINELVWSADLSVLPVAIFEQLQSTNQQFYQRENTLYTTGGYGYSASLDDHITYPNLTAVSLDGLANAVINGNSISSFFRQITDPIFKVTGGHMGFFDATFYLVGGQLFDGLYNPIGPNNGPGFTQIYTDEIRSFQLQDDGTNIVITDYQTAHDIDNLHRRDYNMVPQIFPNGEKGLTAFSGVFNLSDLPYLNSVDITGPTSYVTNNNFNQYLSQYHSAKLPVYDASANVMHTLFFGGMSQFTLDTSGNLVEDINVPFVKTISRISRDSNGAMQEVDLGYIEMPTLVGSGAEFIPIEQYFTDEVLDLNSLPNANTLVGYIYGGIDSSLPNIFFINDGTQSFASNVIFKVFIDKSITASDDEIPLIGDNVLNIQLFPNPVKNDLNFTFFSVAHKDVDISIYDSKGSLIQFERHSVSAIGTQAYNIDVSNISSGMYILKLNNGVVSDQQSFVKE